MSGRRWRWFWEPVPDWAVLDDHGQPARFSQCDGCDRWTQVLGMYSEAAGPCQLWPYAEDDYGEPMELGDPRLDGGGFMCSNCVPVLAFCSACMPHVFLSEEERRAEQRRQKEAWLAEHPPQPPSGDDTPPWAVEGGEGR